MAAKIGKSVKKKVSASGTKQASKVGAKGATPGETAARGRTKGVVRASTAGKARKTLAVATETKSSATETKSSKATRQKTTKQAAEKKVVKKASKKASLKRNTTGANAPKVPATTAHTDGSQVNLPTIADVRPAQPHPSLNVGDYVPEFDALEQSGKTVSNREWAGAPYVLYFYPKDDTPGCTTEACGFRDELPSFDELGVKVVGCSPDSPNAHTRFAQKYGLQFTLLADIEKDLAQLFGVWKLKQNYGREYMGVERTTFLIDKSGKIARQWRGVRVAGHVPLVLQAVRDLS